METKTHLISNTRIAEINSNKVIIESTQDGADLIASTYYQDFDKVILYEKDITPLFFDLKTGIAGEILQKVSNFRMRLAIIGDFEKYESKSMKDFIFESNKNRQVNFVPTLQEALDRLSN